MKIEQLSCPNCKAHLNEMSTKQNVMFCPYCGSKLLFDDGVQRTEHTYRKVDEAKVLQAQNERFVLENKYKDFMFKLKIILIYIGICIVLAVIGGVICHFLDTQSWKAVSALFWVIFSIMITVPLPIYLSKTILIYDSTDVESYESSSGFLGLHRFSWQSKTSPGKKVLGMWVFYIFVMQWILLFIVYATGVG